MNLSRLYHVQRADEIDPIPPEALGNRVSGLRRATLVGRHVGSVHTGFALVELDPDGRVDTHLHSTEQSFYVLEGHPSLVVDGRVHRLAPDECGLLPVGVPHAWCNGTSETARWVEMNAPAPRLAGPPDTFWTGEPVPDGDGDGTAVDIRDPRTRTFFRLGPGDVFWTGVGCVHAFYNRGDGRVRWLETQSPQPPANYSYRFSRDWDYLAERLAEAETSKMGESI